MDKFILSKNIQLPGICQLFENLTTEIKIKRRANVFIGFRTIFKNIKRK